jgi:ABC-type glycerol-3-phosphate transport system substrate-binding protein
MAFYPGRIAHHIERNNPETGAVTTAVAPPYNRTRATWIWPKMYVIPKTARNPELAEDLVDFLMRRDNIAALSMSVPVHSIPPVKDVLESPDFLADPMNAKYKDAIAVEINILEYAMNPSMEHAGLINPYYGAFVGTNIVTNAVQRVMIEGADPKQALQRAAKEMDTFLEKVKQE